MNLGQLIGARSLDDLVDRTPRVPGSPAPVVRTIIRDDAVQSHKHGQRVVRAGLTAGIRRFVAESGGPCTFDQVCDAVGIVELEARHSVSVVMFELTKRGHVTREGKRGSPIYTITERGRRVASHES